MPHLSHNTLRSSPDENGNCHRLCIDPSSDKCQKHIRTYEAKIFSYVKNKYSDPRHEQICIAKFPTTGPGKEEWAKLEVKKSEAVRKTAKIFTHKFTNNKGQLKLVFTCPQHASLDSVATFSKKRCKGEYVVFEDKMESFELFVDNSGRIVETSSTCKSSRRNKNTHSKVKSSEQKTSCACLNSEDQCCSNPEMTTYTQPYMVTPSAPPYEEESLPSYEQLFGMSSYQTTINNNNNSNNNNNFRSNNISSSDHYYMNNLPQTVFYTPYGECPSCFPPPYTEHDQQVHHDLQHSQPSQTNAWVCDLTDNDPHALLTAFIHFDFCLAKGQRIVCNLKGMREKSHSYTLTTPTIHSLTREFGERDQGEVGIMEVIANHVCCSWCRHLPSMQHVFEQAQVNATFSLDMRQPFSYDN